MILLIAVLVVIVLIPLVMSQAGKNVETLTRATNMERTIKKLEGLESLERLEALEGLPELQAELDSILREIDIPEMDSLMIIIPKPPLVGHVDHEREITVSVKTGLPSYEAPPQIIGGSASIYEHLVYPEKLKKAGIEGTVVVQAYIEKDGSVGKAHVLKSSEHDLFDKAALEAVLKIKFEPILRDDEPVTAWVALPVFFKLDE